MKWKLTFVRYGGEEELIFNCYEDACTMFEWFQNSSASTCEDLEEITDYTQYGD